MQLFDSLSWNVYAEACVGDDVAASTLAEPGHTCLQLERSVMECEDESVPLRLCYTVTVPDGEELNLADLHILLTVEGSLDETPIIQWRSSLGADLYTKRAFDVVHRMPIMNMDTDGLHYATAFYTETFPRRWKGIEVFISPIAVHRALNE